MRETNTQRLGERRKKHFLFLPLCLPLYLPLQNISPARDPGTCQARPRPPRGAPFLFVIVNERRALSWTNSKPGVSCGDRCSLLLSLSNSNSKNSRLPPGMSASLARPSRAASRSGRALGESRRGSQVAMGRAPNSNTSRRMETGAGRSPPHADESAAAMSMSTSSFVTAAAAAPLGSTCIVARGRLLFSPSTGQRERQRQGRTRARQERGRAIQTLRDSESLFSLLNLATASLSLSPSDTPLPDAPSSSLLRGETERRCLEALPLPLENKQRERRERRGKRGTRRSGERERKESSTPLCLGGKMAS